MQHAFLNAISASLIGGPDMYSPQDPVRCALLGMAAELGRLDGEFVLKAALYSRQELNIRTTSNLLFAFASHRKGLCARLQPFAIQSISPQLIVTSLTAIPALAVTHHLHIKFATVSSSHHPR